MRLPPLVSLIPIIFLLSSCGAETENSTTPQLIVSSEDAEPLSTPEYTIEEFMGSTAYPGASFSSDASKILVSNNSTGI